MKFKSIEWIGGLDGRLRILDQTKLPHEEVHFECDDVHTLWEAIKTLRIRGAPLIGVAASFGVFLGIRSSIALDFETFHNELRGTLRLLGSARPTAVNLFWALDRMQKVALSNRGQPIEKIKEALFKEAQRILSEDEKACKKIGQNGMSLINRGVTVLTICNTGGLATSAYGTALSVIYHAWENGTPLSVIVCETRPHFQGARLTCWELVKSGIPVTLICDSAAASVMSSGKVQCVITGADRIARNGDTANKVGTLMLAVLAEKFKIPFYVAAPVTTIDRNCPDGGSIPIEIREPDEILSPNGVRIAPEVEVYNPVFDVTPSHLISAIITENGILRPPFEEAIAMLSDSK